MPAWLVVVGVGLMLATSPPTTTSAAFSDSTNGAATTDADQLAPPSGLSVDSATNDGRTLSWTPSADSYANGYEVLRSTTSGSGYTSVGSVFGAATASFTDTTAGCETVTSPTYVGQSMTETPGEQHLTVERPDGTQEGDLLLAVMTIESYTGTETVTAPADWTKVVDESASNVFGLLVYSTVAGTSEPASYTFTFGVGEYASVVVLAYRGVNPTTPFDGPSATVNISYTPTAPSGTATAADALAVRMYAVDVERSHFRPFTKGVSERIAVWTVYQALVISDEAVGAGTVPAKDIWWENSRRHIAATLILRPGTAEACNVAAPARATSAGTYNGEGLDSTWLSVPDGTQVGDYLLAYMVFRRGSAVITPPTGWTTLATGGELYHTYGLYGRVATADDVSTTGDPGTVTAWDGVFSGPSWSLPTGTYRRSRVIALGMEDQPESFTIPAGLLIRVCEHAAATGACGDYTSSVDLTGTAWVDRASYVEVWKAPAYKWSWDGSYSFAATMVAVSDIDPSTPVAAIADLVQTSSKVEVVAPDVTTTAANSKVLRFSSRPDGNLFAGSHISGHSLVSTVYGGDSAGLLVSETTQEVAGPVGPAVFVSRDANRWSTVTVALNPDPTTQTYFYVTRTMMGAWRSADSNEAS